MTMTTFTEADVEQAALGWLAALGWQTAHGRTFLPPDQTRLNKPKIRRLTDW